MILGAIDTGKLLELVWAGALAAIVVTAAFALFILGVTRISDVRRTQRSGAIAAGYFMLALVSAATFVAAVAFGVSVIVSK
jgi:hypothetical protein